MSDDRDIDNLLQMQYHRSRLPQETRAAMLDRIVQSSRAEPSAKTVGKATGNPPWLQMATAAAMVLLVGLILFDAARDHKKIEFSDHTRFLAANFEARIEAWPTGTGKRYFTR